MAKFINEVRAHVDATPSDRCRVEAGEPTIATDTAARATRGFVIVSVAALALAVRMPLDVVVFGILVLGVAHLGFEVRFITGRYRDVLHGRTLVGVSAALGLIVVGRLLFQGTGWAAAEIAILGSTLALVVAATWPRGPRRTGALVAVAALAALAASRPAWWFLSQAWLHNVVPVVFLWQWSIPAAPAARRAFRAVTVTWVAAVPAAILLGAFDGWLEPGSATATTIAASSGARATIVPAGIATTADIVPRLLAAFAFLQLLHYAVWLWHFPRHDREATRTFEATVGGSLLRAWRLPALLVGVATLLAIAAWLDYRSGRGLYTSMAAYHAYLEYPVLLALAWRAPATSDAAPSPRNDLVRHDVPHEGAWR